MVQVLEMLVVHNEMCKVKSKHKISQFTAYQNWRKFLFIWAHSQQSVVLLHARHVSESLLWHLSASSSVKFLCNVNTAGNALPHSDEMVQNMPKQAFVLKVHGIKSLGSTVLRS